MAQIELDRIDKLFGKVEAVVDLSLDIPDGSFVALLGPSGCGKTTTMNMIAGLEVPSTGEIRMNGASVVDVPIGKRNVGFVFQNYAIFTKLTAYENIAYGLRVRKMPAAEVDAAVHRVAKLLDIEPLLGRGVRGLSVNDLQKVAIGRSMIVNPDVFLLDEPFSNLDAGFRAFMRTELKRLQRELGQTMIYVTHDQLEAMSMAEHIAILDRGRLQQWGTPEEVFDSPSNLFVAGFVGSIPMNLIDVGLEHSGRGLVARAVDGGHQPIALSAERRFATTNDGLYKLGFRPEHARLVSPEDDAVDLRGTVSLLEELGPRNIVHVGVDNLSLRVVVLPSVRPTMGERVGLAFERTKFHLFDDSGLALI